MSTPNRPRRLLLVISNLDTLGGMEVQLAHLAGGLARDGHRVRLVSIRSRPGSSAGPRGVALDPGVELVHLGAEGRNAQLTGLRRLVRMARASEIVHCTGWDGCGC